MELISTAIYLFFIFYAFSFIFKLVHQHWRSDRSCYMLAYECHKPTEDEDTRKLSTHSSAQIVFRNKNMGLEEHRFMLKTIVKSGLGDQTYGPKTVMAGREESHSLPDAFSEVDEIIFETLDNLFARTQISPSIISILVVNVSLFSPSPSLTSRIINRYKMRDSIKSFNLSGMGCSASQIAIDVVKNMFITHSNSYAIVVSTECMGTNWYSGKERSMIITNCLFRSGGCSMLFTNNKALKDQAILKLKCMVRTHLGSEDEAYECCTELEDRQGYKGIHLSKSLTKASAKALTLNLKVLLPKILPLRELFRYSMAQIWTMIKAGGDDHHHDFINVKSGVDHFCIHPGSLVIIEGVGKSLKLSEYDLEPSRMALHRFGNTSSCGFLYALGYMEAKKRLRKGDRVLTIGFGSGFKCNNCLWEVMRDSDDGNVWRDCIDSYPWKSFGKINPFMDKFSWLNDD